LNSVSLNVETWTWTLSSFRSKALLRPGSNVPRRSWPFTVLDRLHDCFWPFLNVPWAFSAVYERSDRLRSFYDQKSSETIMKRPETVMNDELSKTFILYKINGLKRSQTENEIWLIVPRNSYCTKSKPDIKKKLIIKR
jgi:hypothetical protein